MLSIHIITIHPAFVRAYAEFGAMKAAVACGAARLEVIDLRDYAVDRHASVDAPPYGGGDGMVMRPEPLAAAVEAVAQATGVKPLVIVTSPAGSPWTQAEAASLSTVTRPVVIVCGRFAGIDQRFIDLYAEKEYSVGDVILTGGELPALMMADAAVRLLPGALGHECSAALESFTPAYDGGLEQPLYTRPPVFRDLAVPEVLMSGNHARIEAWRRIAARQRTRRLRPDLWRGGDGEG